MSLYTELLCTSAAHSCCLHIRILFYIMDIYFQIRLPSHFLTKCKCSPVHIPPPSANIYKYMPCGSNHTHSFSFAVIFGWWGEGGIAVNCGVTCLFLTKDLYKRSIMWISMAIAVHFIIITDNMLYSIKNATTRHQRNQRKATVLFLV
jgi:hypothetical protein